MIRPHWFLAFLPSLLVSVAVYAQSIDDLIQSYNDAAKQNDYNKAALMSYEAAKNYFDNSDLVNAQKFLTESVVYAKRGGLATQQLQSTHLLGKVMFEKRDWSRSLNQFERSIDLARKVHSTGITMESLIFRGKCLANLGRYKKAIDPLNEALSIAITNNFSEVQLTCYKLLGEYYKVSGNDKKAAELSALYQNLYVLHENERKSAEKLSMLQGTVEEGKKETQKEKQKLQEAEMILTSKDDSLYRANQSLKVVEESLNELEVLNRKRQLEIDLLSKERAITKLKIQEQDSRLQNEVLFRNFILVIILLGGTLAVVIVINYRKTVRINKKLDLQNQNVKSSINYAKRIQEAMLPKKEIREKYIKDSFILFRPRDVVSGDFYWFSTLPHKDDVAFGAIDCTGHGVPGAFMSMIGINSLNMILNQGITETNHILDALHREIRNALQQDVTGNNDGMDAALCIYRSERNLLEFSGAKNPIVYIQNGEVFQIKGDIHPVGGSRSKRNLAFRKHEIKVHTPTMMYLFTDGFRDQFGGSENQKFMSKRFTKLLLDIHHLPMEEQQDKLNSVFEEWKGDSEQTDDVLIIGVKLKPNED